MILALFILAGLVALCLGGEMLVRGASNLASGLGISPLVVGLTVVSFGTSTPELAICLNAVFSDNSSLAVGNVVGSNISNVLLILGITALVTPLFVTRQLIRLDVPIMIGASLLFAYFVTDHQLTQIEGLILVSCFILYLLKLTLHRKSSESAAEAEHAELAVQSHWLVNLGWVALGILALVLGANWLVHGAVGFATMAGVSPLVIGLTIVAIGSSMPEVATAVIAARKGHGDLAIGSVVGSNLSNLLFVAGVSAFVSKEPIPIPYEARVFDIPVMVGAALLCVPVFISQQRITRWEGGLFLGSFVAYSVYLFLDATNHPLLPDLLSRSSSLPL